ncbi:hypothetical protein [Occallatibacter riparius]|uniref:Uncharacterized protein n=1 Tax=Occallatibacter riparius TaxID=1002689 RepID=A0A9J7BR81_9BACT|nr:hypothetical protein [Occallatibacter riparius]UWZ83438.1 hypothetical protein MOP44_23085 [Occallatibacter riparius]
MTQFRILRRIFLNGLLDFELLSSEADTSRLVGQFATLLASVSLAFTLPILLIGGLPQDAAWGMEHFLFATTMAVAGLFGMISWESIFPDRKDLLILGPLPLSRTTLFLAKISALSSALLVAIVALNAFTGLGWVILFEPEHGGVSGLIRCFLAYWLTAFMAGSFMFFAVLIAHGLSSLLLPRKTFLRWSGFIQVLGFVLVLADYILEPSMESLAALAAPANQFLLHALPSYWFLGVFQQLNGSMRFEFEPLARLGWLGFGVAAAGALFAVSMAYRGALSRIIEEPDVRPSSARGRWLLNRAGSSRGTAVLFFSWRTLLRSRQHRLAFGFFLAVGMSVMLLSIVLARAEDAMGRVAPEHGMSFLIGTTMMMALSVLGARIVIGIPTALRANWIFQITQVASPRQYVSATQRTLLSIGVVPAWLVCLVLAAWAGASWIVVAHMCVLALLGVIGTNAAVFRLHKLPFTCSWSPGKVNVLVTFFGGVIVGIPLTSLFAKLEIRLLQTPLGIAVLLACLSSLAVVSQWLIQTSSLAVKHLSFEDREEPALVGLNLRQTRPADL